MKSFAILAAGVTLALATGACGTNSKSNVLTASGLDPENFIGERDGKATALYTLKNGNGMEASSPTSEAESCR